MDINGVMMESLAKRYHGFKGRILTMYVMYSSPSHVQAPRKQQPFQFILLPSLLSLSFRFDPRSINLEVASS